MLGCLDKKGICKSVVDLLAMELGSYSSIRGLAQLITSVNKFLNNSRSILGLPHIILKGQLCWSFIYSLEAESRDGVFELSGQCCTCVILKEAEREHRLKCQG